VSLKNIFNFKTFSISGEIGDVVVGRVTEVQQKRWKVDINCRLDAGNISSLFVAENLIVSDFLLKLKN
jgi:exosome complex RNA-binding protein Rrp4